MTFAHFPTEYYIFCVGSKIRLVTLDLAIDLLKGMVVGSDGRSYLADTHFAELEGIREESTLLLRNFYKVIFDPVLPGLLSTTFI